MKRDKTRNVEYSLLCKLIRRKLKEDFKDFFRRRLLAAAEKRQSLKEVQERAAIIPSDNVSFEVRGWEPGH